MCTSRPSKMRLLAVLLAGPLALLVLGLACFLHYRWANGGISGWMADSFRMLPVRRFAIQYGLRILLPIYTVTGIGIWFLTLIPFWLVDRAWARKWTGGQALALILTGFLWLHTVLWWQVPTALWVVPGLRRIPFLALFPVLVALSLMFAGKVLRRHGLSWWRSGVCLAAWFALWTLPGLLPQVLPVPRMTPRPGNQPCRVLLIGLDGLRSDTFLAGAGQLKGLRYENSYTVIPATRLLWHILWGGDPLFYTVGHMAPSIEELEHPDTLTILKDASSKGWKPRFYIDDGGTIGLAERKMDLDDALAPAEGWENFVNSNLAVSFPLYAAWENWFKPFPTTNPWAPLDAGLREALRLGHGSGLVMFHSCLAHQPIFLNRSELAQTGRWWTLPPIAYQPLVTRMQVLRFQAEHPDPRTNPFLTYRIRMNAILRAWEPVWNALDQDPDYRGAVRVLFSDHGERFHHVGPNDFQLQGVHGFNLDSWECRATMLVAGQGFSDEIVPQPRPSSTSLLALRDGIRRLLDGKGAFDADFLEHAYSTAPIRFHTIDQSNFVDDPPRYREMKENDLAVHTFIGSHGLWYTKYDQVAQERAKDVSVGLASGPDLWIYKPLVKGGADEFHYRSYLLQNLREVDEATYQEKRHEVEALLHPSVPMIEGVKAGYARQTTKRP